MKKILNSFAYKNINKCHYIPSPSLSIGDGEIRSIVPIKFVLKNSTLSDVKVNDTKQNEIFSTSRNDFGTPLGKE